MMSAMTTAALVLAFLALAVVVSGLYLVRVVAADDTGHAFTRRRPPQSHVPFRDVVQDDFELR